ncbi:MAG: virulence RhuM family protein [Bacteroidales bacterium]|nr:virulence RhuM family protein [Bacteroidales bacterium]
MNKGEIILYQPDDDIRLEVRMEDETVWLTQAQIGLLFGVQKAAISKHLKNIFESGELQQQSVVSILETTAHDGKKYATRFYNLDAVLSVGYRVNSAQATQFRIWANHILKEYILRGAAVNQRFELVEERLRQNELDILSVHQKVDHLVKTALPPRQGIFFDGQIFDAYTFAADLIRKAKKRIILIDNFVDDSVLKMLTKRTEGVTATIVTRRISDTLAVDIERHNRQYPPIQVRTSDRFHDRFLILDDTVYHLGASLKDLGKKLFAFCRMEVGAELLLNV